MGGRDFHHIHMGLACKRGLAGASTGLSLTNQNEENRKQTTHFVVALANRPA